MFSKQFISLRLLVPFLALSVILTVSAESWQERLKNSIKKSPRKALELVAQYSPASFVMAAGSGIILYYLYKGLVGHEEPVSAVGDFAVTFTSPFYGIQKRLYDALLAMHLETIDSDLEVLRGHYKVLTTFNHELKDARFGDNNQLADVSIKLVELLNAMDDCISFPDKPYYIHRYEAMLVKYVELLSLLSETSYKLIKTVTFKNN